MSDLYWLTDAQMARLEPFIPKSQGKPRDDGRRVLSGIVLINRNGLRGTVGLFADIGGFGCFKVADAAWGGNSNTTASRVISFFAPFAGA